MLDDESNDATLTEDSAEDTQAEVDWQKRYTDTQAEYTRNQQALSDERRVWDDEQAALARVQEKFPHWFEDEEETETEDGNDFDDEPDLSQFATKKELEEFKTWRAGIDSERGETRYQEDLAKELGDREVPEQVHAWIKDRTMALGGNQKALKQAVEEFDAITEQLGSKKKPRVPHVPKGGSAGTGVKDFSQMSRDEIDEWTVERARALAAEHQ